MKELPPSPYPEVNRVLDALLAEIQPILGVVLAGFYLDGSLANGGFDHDSDIDFICVTEEPVPEEQFLALQAMHDRLAKLDSPWAIQLEGFYLSRQAVRRHRFGEDCVPNLERGRGERLKWLHLGSGFDVHRWILREKGITLLGPAPETLVDPVPPGRLIQVMQDTLSSWADSLLNRPGILAQRGYQSYVVLTLCRILYTLEYGEVTSKQAAASWALPKLERRWGILIERAWGGRSDPERPALPEEQEETLAFLSHVMEATRR